MLNKFTIRGKEFTVLTLSNGKRVGNFSSPHEFKFTDGSILPAVSDERGRELSMVKYEVDYGNGDMLLAFYFTPIIEEEMEIWESLKEKNEVDIVFCPLPMFTKIRERLNNLRKSVRDVPFRVVYIEDRIEKKVSITKQCI